MEQDNKTSLLVALSPIAPWPATQCQGTPQNTVSSGQLRRRRD